MTVTGERRSGHSHCTAAFTPRLHCHAVHLITTHDPRLHQKDLDPAGSALHRPDVPDSSKLESWTHQIEGEPASVLLTRSRSSLGELATGAWSTHIPASGLGEFCSLGPGDLSFFAHTSSATPASEQSIWSRVCIQVGAYRLRCYLQVWHRRLHRLNRRSRNSETRGDPRASMDL